MEFIIYVLVFGSMFYFSWCVMVYGYLDMFYWLSVLIIMLLFVDLFVTYLSVFPVGFFVVLDNLIVRFLLSDMDPSWDSNGGSKYTFLFYICFMNYLFLLAYQLTWLHFGVVFDLFNLFMFMFPLFFGYFLCLLFEYGFSFVTFMVGNSWVRTWFFSDIFEWFGSSFSLFLNNSIFGSVLFSSLIGLSVFGLSWPFSYLYVCLVSFVYLFYIPIACFVRYVAVFTALSVLWNVWVTVSFSVMTSCFGFFGSVVFVPSWFYFSVLFLSFEGSYVLIHITLLMMLYMNIVGVVLSHNNLLGFSNFISFSFRCGYLLL